MSFQSRLPFDSCTYKHNLKQSVGTGDYMLGTPLANCRICFSTDPAIRLSRGSGVSTCDSVPLIDADSELKNLTRRASDCPTEKYLPTGKAFCHTHDYKDCTTLPTEDTRISNPTCTMRCTGVNRWEWLCQNPQDKALIPFDYNINNRLVVKDNHRPCVPQPINQAMALPMMNDSDAMVQYNPGSCMKPNMDLQSTSWRKCCEYSGYTK